MGKNLDEFINENEHSTNLLLSKAMLFIIPVFPLLLVANLIGVFPGIDKLLLLIVACIYSGMTTISYFSIRRKPFKKHIKFVLLFSVELLVFALSLARGLNFFITYVFVVALSTLYFDKKFTIQCIAIGYFLMFISLYIRSQTMLETNYRISRIAWFYSYTAGGTMEFALYSMFCVFLAITINEVITQIYQGRKTINETYDQLENDFQNIEREVKYSVKKNCPDKKDAPDLDENSRQKIKFYFDDYNDNFFSDYEKKQNMLVLRIAVWVWFCIPVCIVGKIAGVFPQMEYEFLLLLTGVYTLGLGITICIMKFRPESPSIKYFLLGTIGTFLFLASINKGFEVFITYAMLPLMSCLYLNKKFSIKVIIASFIFMVASMAIRAAVNVPGYVLVPADKPFPTPLQWFIGYTLGLTFEYIINTIAILCLINRNQKIVMNDYRITKVSYKAQTDMISKYVNLLSLYNPELEKHSRNTAAYCSIICNKLAKQEKYKDVLSDEMIFKIKSAALLHDIGIVAIPDSIVYADHELSYEEREILNQHIYFGTNLLKENMLALDKDFLKLFCDMTLYHHEYWGGGGYPGKLRKEEIPLCARILAGANLIDNLLSGKATGTPVRFDDALPIIADSSGKRLDPDVAQAIQNSEMELWKYYDSVDWS